LGQFRPLTSPPFEAPFVTPSLLNPCAPGQIDIDATFLPIGQMRQISRVTAIEGARIEGGVDLGPGHWVFAQHFPGDPIFPGTLMIEAAGQLVALWAWANGQRGRPRLVRTGAEFHRPVTPETARLELRGTVERRRHLHFATVLVTVAGCDVATVTAVLAVLPPL
jgi:3-hydroxymyristoyl/3-hydroxydecanoyl-(acyl carrier protein) dehydratase